MVSFDCRHPSFPRHPSATQWSRRVQARPAPYAVVDVCSVWPIVVWFPLDQVRLLGPAKPKTQQTAFKCKIPALEAFPPRPGNLLERTNSTPLPGGGS